MALTVTPAALPDMQQGRAYSKTIAASGGTAPYSFAVTSGSLPAGLILNASTGVISGTPTGSGAASFTITATDSAGSPDTGSRAYTPTVQLPHTLSNSLIDGYAQQVPAPYGPLTRVTSVATLPTPNINADLELTDSSGATIKATFQQLADTEAIQRQIALAQGNDYIMHTLYTQVAALKTYFDSIYESDGDGYTYAEYTNVIEDLREIAQISGLL